MITLGQRLVQLRESQNIKQRDIADYLGITVRGLRYYETDVREPKINTIIALASFFNVSLDYLLGVTDIPCTVSDYVQKQINKAQNLENYHESFEDIADSFDYPKPFKNTIVNHRNDIIFNANPADVIKEQIAQIGKQEYSEALKKILDENGLLVIDGFRSKDRTNDPDLDKMIGFLIDLWELGEADLKAWAKVQFSRAFPQDIKDEIQKKRSEIKGNESTA